ncbi:hypothetical protein MAM1_0201d07891 [Mucor ambiguus]|uniref:BZIP domain-containing protein n=1 Tax=Mucor ambiguus TaxID=91626 RepID=A0A0C9MXS2_9FUNG|nr:hypothetical protein MAM1_0201d07891 [Mucor ambiguus]
MDHYGGQTMDNFVPSDSSKNKWYYNQQQQQPHQQPHHHPHPHHQQNAYNTNSLGAIYVSNVPLMTHSPQQQQPPQQQFDEHGQPIKIRKKPGRKPNPASPALRKAQNRAAQRAFRERKERHLKDLEGTIRQLREQRNSAVKELNQTKSKMDAFRAENWYLKGVVLTLQFVCLHHNIHIPTHSPYLTEEALSEMAKTTPHAIEAYVNAYTRNNINLKPTMAAHFANSPATDKGSPEQPTYNDADDEDEQDDTEMMDENNQQDEDDQDDEYSEQRTSESNAADYRRHSSLSSDTPYHVKLEEEDDETMTQWIKQHNENKKLRDQAKKDKEEAGKSKKDDGTSTEENGGDDKQPNPSSISAIQRIRLQLRVQSTISNIGKSSARLQPTILQLAIPHDPRIDLVPTPHMRDRMIIFRDQMDYDRCFAMLLNGALYHGGDPTMSASWELPAEFFSEFWYLAINYDVNRTNTWRRLKGLPEIGVSTTKEAPKNGQTTTAQHRDWHETILTQPPTAIFIEQQQDEHLQQHQQHQQAQPQDVFSTSQPSSSDSVWTDDVFAQMTAGMPTLQPLDSNHLSSGFDFGSPPANMFDGFLLHRANAASSPIDLSDGSTHPMFEQLMSSIPDSRQERSPSINAMMDLMHSLSTDMNS